MISLSLVFEIDWDLCFRLVSDRVDVAGLRGCAEI